MGTMSCGTARAVSDEVTLLVVKNNEIEDIHKPTDADHAVIFNGINDFAGTRIECHHRKLFFLVFMTKNESWSLQSAVLTILVLQSWRAYGFLQRLWPCAHRQNRRMGMLQKKAPRYRLASVRLVLEIGIYNRVRAYESHVGIRLVVI